MDLILITDSLDTAAPLLKVAEDSGYRILKLLESNDDVSQYVISMQPDVLLFISDDIDRVLLRQMRVVTEKKATPIIIFTRDSSAESIDAAVTAGAITYVVDCSDPGRLPSLTGVARARFNQQQKMKKELAQTKNALQERKSVEKAKGIIMRSKSVTEDQAYKAMRKLAMNHNKRIGEIDNHLGF